MSSDNSVFSLENIMLKKLKHELKVTNMNGEDVFINLLTNIFGISIDRFYIY